MFVVDTLKVSDYSMGKGYTDYNQHSFWCLKFEKKEVKITFAEYCFGDIFESMSIWEAFCEIAIESGCFLAIGQGICIVSEIERGGIKLLRFWSVHGIHGKLFK